MVNIQSILHGTVIVADLEVSQQFYCGVLGLSIDSDRPDLGYPGLWLDVGQQQIHLMQLPNPDPVDGRPVHGGRDRHIALAVVDLDQLLQQLAAAGIVYSVSKSGRKAMFCRDPDGNTLEFIQVPLSDHLP